jgi:hypothetical protein
MDLVLKDPVRSASAHGEQPVAPRHRGRRHGRDRNSGDDDDAVTRFHALRDLSNR